LDTTHPHTRRERLLLGPLRQVDVEVMLAERFGDRLPRRRLAQVAFGAGGYPVYAAELATVQLVPDGRGVEDGLVLPPGLEELLAARLDRLPAHASAPMAAAACMAAPTMAMVVSALGEDARAGLDCALDAGVLRVAAGRVWFTHPRSRCRDICRPAASKRDTQQYSSAQQMSITARSRSSSSSTTVYGAPTPSRACATRCGQRVDHSPSHPQYTASNLATTAMTIQTLASYQHKSRSDPYIYGSAADRVIQRRCERTRPIRTCR
jgi:hypothetical protein